jgi:hypothetical protein
LKHAVVRVNEDIASMDPTNDPHDLARESGKTSIAGQPSKPVTIGYRSPQTSSTFGSTIWVRVAAGFAAVGLLGAIVHFLLRSRETLGGVYDWILPISAAAGGAAYCVLIALNIAGRKKT